MLGAAESSPGVGRGAGDPGAAGRGEGLVQAGSEASAAWRVVRWRGTRLSTINFKRASLGVLQDSE